MHLMLTSIGRRPHWLIGLLMGLMIPASMFQDTALQHSPLSIAAASPAFFLIFSVWLLWFTAKTRKTHARQRYVKSILIAVFFYMALNVYFGFKYGIFAYGENLFIKGLKTGILFFSLIYTVWLFYFNIVPRMSFWVRAGAYVAFFGLIVDHLAHDILVRNWWLHYGVNDDRFELVGFDDRPRGFSYESSTLGITLMVVGLMVTLTSKNFKERIFWLVCTGIAIFYCGSKAAFPIFLVSVLLAIILTQVRSVKFALLFSCPFFATFAYMTLDLWWQIFEQIIIMPFILDLEHSTSFATRVTMALSAILNLLEYPLGVGFTGYLPALVGKIQSASDLINQLLGLPLNLGEVSNYLYQDSSFAIGAKSFFLDNMIVFGLPFVGAWFGGHWLMINRLQKINDFYGLILLVGMFIPLTFYVPGVSLYILAIAYGYLIQRSCSQINIQEVKNERM